MATFCNMTYTWDANKNKTSESITGVMSGYGFTSAGTTAGNEDLCFSSSLSPPASSLLIDIDANGTADVNFQYDLLGRRVARSGTGGSVVYVQIDQQTIANYPGMFVNVYRSETWNTAIDVWVRNGLLEPGDVPCNSRWLYNCENKSWEQF